MFVRGEEIVALSKSKQAHGALHTEGPARCVQHRC